MVELDFDAREVEPQEAFAALPAGQYPVAITGSEKKPTKAGDGAYLELEFTVIDGPFKGRKAWARLNIENKSPDAVRIARGELSSICRAVNVLTPKNSGELHNIPLVITVKVKNDGQGNPSNEVKGYSAAATQQPGQAPAVKPNPAPSSATTPPWQRK